MATSPPNAVTTNPLVLQVLSVNGNVTTVSVNGRQYKFTVFKGSGNNWTDITATRDWQQLAQHVADLFRDIRSTTLFEKAELTLNGDFADLDSPDQQIPQRNVTLESAKYSYKEGTNTREEAINGSSLATLPTETQTRITTGLQTLGQDFVAATRTVRSSPIDGVDRTSPPVVSPVQIPSIPVNGSGNCLVEALNLGIVYQTWRSQHPTEIIDPTPLRQHAQQLLNTYDLRTLATAIILTDIDLPDDPSFFYTLRASISHIPAFSTEARYLSTDGQVIKQASKEKILPTLLGDDESKFNEINTIIGKTDISLVTPEEKRKLRELYAHYINQRPDYNYLDSAFLYVLPKIKEIPGFPDGIKYAILQNGAVIQKNPGSAELKADWVFVIYNGVNHYEAVDMQTGAAVINNIISNEKDKILTEFLDLFRRQSEPTNPDLIKTELLTKIKFEYPKAYQALARLAYDYEHAEWELKQRNGVEPGTVETHHEGINYPSDRYGEWRLHSWTFAQFKTLSSRVTNEQIRAKIQSIP